MGCVGIRQRSVPRWRELDDRPWRDGFPTRGHHGVGAAGVHGIPARRGDVAPAPARRPALRPGIPRTVLEDATITAAQWAGSDRQAALLLCLPVQQRLLSPDRLWQAWTEVSRSSRRSAIDAVLHDVCHGAQSLGELDFARWCRRYRLPEPARQTLRHGPRGRIYLDVEWPAHRLVVEIDGVPHGQGLNPVWDALRANEVTLGDNRVLRLPVLGLRLMPQEFMAQVARALGATPVRMTVMPNAARGARSA